jgi:hypothetical protein
MAQTDRPWRAMPIGMLGLCGCKQTGHPHHVEGALCGRQGAVSRIANVRYVFCWLCNDHAPNADPPAFPNSRFRAARH